MTKMLHISHTDLDGYGCHILSHLIKRSLPQGSIDITYENIAPSRVEERTKMACTEVDNKEWDKVVITDLNITPGAIDAIAHCSNPDAFRVFDHHVTPIMDDEDFWKEDPLREKVRPYFSIHSSLINGSKGSIDTCGTELYYQFIKNGADYGFIKLFIGTEQLTNVAYFVECVRAWDTRAWATTLNDESHARPMCDIIAPRLNNLFHTFSHEKFIEYCIDYFHYQDAVQLTYSSDNYPSIPDILEIIEEIDKRYVTRVVKRATKSKLFAEIDGVMTAFNAGVVIADRCYSDIGANIMQNYDVDVAIVMNDNQASIYSNKPTIDCSKIARYFGGGGHKGAAGFSITYMQSKAMVDGFFKKMCNYALYKQ